VEELRLGFMLADVKGRKNGLHGSGPRRASGASSRKTEMGEGIKGKRGTYNPTITRESKHHPRVTRHGKQPTMPHTNHDKTHQHHGSILPKHIHENLQHGLAIRAPDRVLEILDAEQETEEDEEAEKSGEADGGDDTDRRRPGSLPGLLGKMGRGVKTSKCILRHERATTSNIRRTSPHTPPDLRPRRRRPIIKRCKHKLGTLMRRRFRQDRNRQGGHTCRVQDDRAVVEIAEDVDAEGVDHAVGDEDGGVDADYLSWGGDVRGIEDGCRGADEICEAEGDARCYCDLAEEVEPVLRY
jgi:hypothetical protein